MKNIMFLLFFCLTANYSIAQTVVKLALPNNCNAGSVNVINGTIDEVSIIELFPNPNSGIFTFVVSFVSKIEKATIQVYDMSGKPVFSEIVFSDSYKLVKQLNLTKLQPGTYIIEFFNTKEEVYTTLIIKNQ